MRLFCKYMRHKTNKQNKNRKTRIPQSQFVAQLLDRLTMGYLVLMLSVYALFPGLNGYQSITEWKWYLFCLLTGGYLAIVLLLIIEFALVGSIQSFSLKELWKNTSLPEKLLLAYWFASGLSVLFSVDRGVAFWGGMRREGFITISLCCGSCIILSHLCRPEQWMLYLFGVVMCLNCVLCAFQIAGYNPLFLYPVGMNYYDAYRKYAGEFLGTFGNVDILSAVLCLAVPAFAVAVIKAKGISKWFFLLFAVVSFSILCAAHVSGGAVGVLVCTLISVPVLIKNSITRRRALVIAAIICIVGIIFIYLYGGFFGGTIWELSELLHGHWDDSFGTGRLYIWRNILPLIPKRILFGGGPDTLSLRLDAAFERWDNSLGLIRSSIDTAHNEYLGILVDQGLIALLFYLGMLFILVVKWFRHAANNNVIAICGCAILAYCIQAFFGIRSPISTPYFYLALALFIKEDKGICERHEYD